jgi:hypothetical protein
MSSKSRDSLVLETSHVLPNININLKKKIIIEEVSESKYQNNMQALYEYSSNTIP